MLYKHNDWTLNPWIHMKAEQAGSGKTVWHPRSQVTEREDPSENQSVRLPGIGELRIDELNKQTGKLLTLDLHMYTHVLMQRQMYPHMH